MTPVIAIALAFVAGAVTSYLVAAPIVRFFMLRSRRPRLVVTFAFAGSLVAAPSAVLAGFFFGGNFGGALGAGLSEWFDGSSVGALPGVVAGIGVVTVAVVAVGALAGALLAMGISRLLNGKVAA